MEVAHGGDTHLSRKTAARGVRCRERTMKRAASVPFLWMVVAAFCGGMMAPAAMAEVSATLDIDVNKPGAAIPKTFYGLMTEEINHSYDGGLFAELIQNRTFQDPPPRGRGGPRGGPPQTRPQAPPTQPATQGMPVHWSLIGDGKAIAVREDPVNAALPVSLRLDLSGAAAAGVANDGYWGIPVRPDTTYSASFYAKGGGGFAGPVNASLLLDDGNVTVAK